MQVLAARSHRALASMRRGFTLVELLIVLVILGILAAILLPAFSRVRDNSHTATCASNLRQIGLAMTLYTGDHGGFYPPYQRPSEHCSWADRVFRYIKSEEVLWCPSFEEGEYRAGCAPAEEVGGQNVRYDGSYSINTLEDAWAGGPAQVGVPERRVRVPSSTVLVLDGKGVAGYVNPGVHKDIATVEQLEGMGVPRRHNEGVNVLFADGHVQWRDLPSLIPRKQWRATSTD